MACRQTGFTPQGWGCTCPGLGVCMAWPSVEPLLQSWSCHMQIGAQQMPFLLHELLPAHGYSILLPSCLYSLLNLWLKVMLQPSARGFGLQS